MLQTGCVCCWKICSYSWAPYVQSTLGRLPSCKVSRTDLLKSYLSVFVTAQALISLPGSLRPAAGDLPQRCYCMLYCILLEGRSSDMQYAPVFGAMISPKLVLLADWSSHVSGRKRLYAEFSFWYR